MKNNNRDFAVAVLSFCFGCLVSALIMLVNGIGESDNNFINLLQIIFLLVFPIAAVPAGLITYRYKARCKKLEENSIKAESLNCSFYPKDLTKGRGLNAEVEVSYSFKARDGNVYSSSKKHFYREIKRFDYLKELEKKTLTILYDPNNPRDNIWEMELNYLKNTMRKNSHA